MLIRGLSGALPPADWFTSRWYTVDDAAVIAGVGDSTMRQWVREGRVETVQTTDGTRVKWDLPKGPWLRPAEAARLAGVSKWEMTSWMERGKVRTAVYPTGEPRVLESSLPKKAALPAACARCDRDAAKREELQQLMIARYLERLKACGSNR